MSPDVAKLVYALPAGIRPVAQQDVRGLKPAAAAKLIQARYGGLLGDVDVPAYLADVRKTQNQKDRAAAGAQKGQVKNRMAARYSVAADWKPDYTGRLDPEIFTPRYGTIPKYVLPLLRSMNRVTLGTVLAAAYRVDNRGAFVLQRGKLADWLGTTPRLAGEALALLRRAGLVRVLHQGYRAQASIYRLAPVAEVDIAQAARVLQGARSDATADVRRRVR
jgi:DNA-binding transcriptional ArsR family regulator